MARALRPLAIRLCAAFVLWAAAVASWPVQAEPVSIRTAPHRGYGRIVFNWPAAVPYQADVEGSRLTVRFGRPIETDVGSAVRTLAGYLNGGEIDADGRTVRFSTTRDFDVRAFDLGNAIVVDLLDRPDPAATPPRPVARAPAAPPASPPETAAARPAVPALGVRTGEHEGYTRVVFDWPERVGYSVDRAGGRVTVSFDRPARPGLDRIRARPPKYIGGVGATQRDDELQVSMDIPETSRLRHFRVGSKVAFDVMAPDPTAGAEPRRSAAAPEPAPDSRTAAAPRTTAVPESTEPASPASTEDVQPMNRPTPLVPVQSGALTPPAQTRAPSEAQPLAVTSRDVTAPVAGTAQATGPTEAPAGAITLRFNWSEPVAASVFRRAGHLWVAFDKPRSVDIEALRRAAGGAIRDISQIPVESGTVLRLETVAGVNPGLRRDGLAWLLDFQTQPLEPREPIDVQVQTNSPIGPRVFLPVAQPGTALVVPDPEVGDTMVVVPVIPLGYGVAEAGEYPQFSLLPTAQGIAVRATIDTLRVRPLRQGVELTSSDPLQISAVSEEQAAGAQLAATRSPALSRILDFDPWLHEEQEPFRTQKRNYLEAAALAEGAAKETARMDVARLYLAHGFAAETLGVLRTMAGDREGIQANPEFKALQGASNFLMGRFREATDNWYHTSLNDNDEATLWRAVLAAREGDTVRASRVLRQTGPILQSYPQVLRVPLGLIAADAAIDVGDIRQASQLLDVLRTGGPTEAQSNQITYEEGRLLELAGDFEGAVGKWEEVELSAHRPSRARATVARTELLLKLERITPVEAIEEYERLRYAWRGDDFEFNLLRRLGQLYMAESDYRNGLRTLRQLVTNFRDHRDTQFVTQEMTEAFAKLYLDGAADVLPPVTAIALYDEFRELTPAGEKGDEMVRKLADRLVAVDLLDRAATLLEEQVEFRLTGTEKARVGAQLALIRSMADQPEQALKALEESDGASIPGDLRTKRRHLQARALIEQGRTDAALRLLEEDETLDAQRLRSEIYWKAQDWPRAAQVLGQLIREAGVRPQQPLTEKQALTVVNYAIALTLSDNERGVARARQDFIGPMDDTPYRDAFRLITARDAGDAMNARDVASKVQDAENFQTFLSEYRERLKTQTLSELFSGSASESRPEPVPAPVPAAESDEPAAAPRPS